MAARRLLIVMLILLGISTLAAALAPTHPPGSDTGTTTTEPAVPPPTPEAGAGQGRLWMATIDADSERLPVVGTGRIRLHAGDELLLEVRSRRSDQVEIPAFGEIQAVSRDAPASFDLLLDEPGSYNVRLVDAGRNAGRLEVTPAARPGSGSGKGSGRRAQQ
jgi:hypothetical protein